MNYFSKLLLSSALLATILLAGCSVDNRNNSGGTTGTGTGGGTGTGSAPSPGNFLFTADVNGKIQSLTRDPASGMLTPVNTGGTRAQFSAGAAIQSLSGVPNGQFLYAATSSGIAAFKIDSQGTLTAIPGSPFALPGANPVDSTVSRDSAQLFVLFKDSNQLSSYPIDPQTGALASPSTVPTGKEPRAVSLDSSGQYIYVGNFADFTVSGFTVNGLQPVPGSPFDVKQRPDPLVGPVVLTHARSFLYVFSDGDQLGYAVDVASGTITQLPSQESRDPSVPQIPYHLSVVNTAPRSMVGDPNSEFLVANSSAPAVPPNFVTLFQVSTGGLLSDVGTVPETENLIMNFPLAIAPDGHFIYRVAMADPNCVVDCPLAIETISVSGTAIRHVDKNVNTGSSETITGIDKKTFQMVTSPYSP
jgi:6-phosphogluconolactonase (cycloisomerase 2 family)